jgi:hypothetical protein
VDSELAVDITTAQVQAIIENARRLGLIWTLRPATVGTVDPLTVVDDADTVGKIKLGAVSLIGPLNSGARVMTLVVPPGGLFVIGALAPPGSPAIDVYAFTNQTGNTTGSTSYITSAIVVEVPFIMGQSGRVNIFWGAEISNTAAAASLLALRVYDTITPTLDLVSANDDATARNDNAATARSTAFTQVTGVPGHGYTAQLQHRVTGGTGRFDRRRVLVQQAQ